MSNREISTFKATKTLGRRLFDFSLVVLILLSTFMLLSDFLGGTNMTARTVNWLVDLTDDTGTNVIRQRYIVLRNDLDESVQWLSDHSHLDSVEKQEIEELRDQQQQELYEVAEQLLSSMDRKGYRQWKHFVKTKMKGISQREEVRLEMENLTDRSEIAMAEDCISKMQVAIDGEDLEAAQELSSDHLANAMRQNGLSEVQIPVGSFAHYIPDRDEMEVRYQEAGDSLIYRVATMAWDSDYGWLFVNFH